MKLKRIKINKLIFTAGQEIPGVITLRAVVVRRDVVAVELEVFGKYFGQNRQGNQRGSH